MAVRRTATRSLSERELLGAYPFLPGAEGLVSETAPTLRALLDEPALARARELGRSRVRWGVDDPTGAAGVSELAHATDDERLLAFLYAWLLLSALARHGPLRRWAVAEAKAAYARLRAAPVDELVEVARRLNRRFSEDRDPGGIRIAVADYLRLAVPIREADYRLVSQELRGGWVVVGRERAARLLQEGIRLRLAEPFELDPALQEGIDQHEHAFLEEVLSRVPPPRASPLAGDLTIVPAFFPPCIRRMRRLLENGENLSHAGRFALAAYLHRLGAAADAIVDAYRGAPDFDEGVTRYQVEHITQRDGGRGYEPPGCDKLRTDGLCARDGDPTAPVPDDRARDPVCFDPALRHPLQYYRWKGGRISERAPPV